MSYDNSNDFFYWLLYVTLKVPTTQIDVAMSEVLLSFFLSLWLSDHRAYNGALYLFKTLLLYMTIE